MKFVVTLIILILSNVLFGSEQNNGLTLSSSFEYNSDTFPLYQFFDASQDLKREARDSFLKKYLSKKFKSDTQYQYKKVHFFDINNTVISGEQQATINEHVEEIRNLELNIKDAHSGHEVDKIRNRIEGLWNTINNIQKGEN